MSKLLFLARPSYGPYEPESDYAAHNATAPDSPLVVHACGYRQSMTCHNMNQHLATCLTAGGYDYFAMLHADNAPADGWADTLVEQLERHNLDIIHAPAAFKNKSGKTSTAMGFSDNIWAPCRRIMTRELKKLPQTFDIDVLREVLEPKATRMLFNTGCMVAKIGDWLPKYPGFTMADTIVQFDGKYVAMTVSEDYMFAHWCANNGIRAGATKVVNSHIGRWNYSTADEWGAETDEEYYAEVAAIEAAKV